MLVKELGQYCSCWPLKVLELDIYKSRLFEVLKIECIRKVLSAFLCQKAKGCSVCGL